MAALEHLALGFSTALTPANLWACLAGALLGTVVGVLPGLGPATTIALLLPFTFSLSPTGAVIMLAGIYYGAQYGGSVTAILVNVPGEASSAITCVDGHAMARDGRAGLALAVAAISSFVGGTAGTLLVAILALPLSALAARFEAADHAALMLCGLVAAIVIAHGSVAKAVAMTALGLGLGTIGTDVASGRPRFTMGIPELHGRRRLHAARHRDLRSGRSDRYPGARQRTGGGVRPPRTDPASPGKPGAPRRRPCAARWSDRSWASCPAEDPPSPPLRPTRSRSGSRPVRRGWARAPSKVWPAPSLRTTRPPRRLSYRC